MRPIAHPPAKPSRLRRALNLALKAMIAAIVALFGYIAFAGYFDREIMVRVPATARPTPAHAHLAAVYFSGDMGYRLASGRMIGNRLAADGIPLVGINSLGYFRRHRTVAEVAALTAKAMRQAMAMGHTDQVVLIGQSLGSDALQAALVDLPHDLRAKVRTVVLIVPTTALYLQVSPGEMMDWSAPDGKVLPSLRRLTWVPMTCIYGAEEATSPCPHLHAPNVRKVALPGGHAMHRDIARIHATVIAAIDAAAPRNITKISGEDHLGASSGGPHAGHRLVD